MNLFKLLTITALLTVTNLVKAQCESPTFDGYTYDVVQIGNQCWFAENLRTTILRDGTPITLITDNNGTDTTIVEESRNNPTGLYRAALPDTLNGLSPYNSHMYYGYGVQLVGDEVCPTGWRMPTMLDRNILFTENDINDLTLSPTWNEGVIRADINSNLLVNGFLTESVPDSNFNFNPYLGNNSLGFNLIPTGRINGYGGDSYANNLDLNNWNPAGYDWSLRTEIVIDGTTPTGEPLEVELKRIDWFQELQNTLAALTTGPGLETWQEGPRHKATVSPWSYFWLNHETALGFPFVNQTHSAANVSNSPEDGYTMIADPTVTLYYANSYAPIRCVYTTPVPGCTDELACNYDPEATEDDGSCEYPQEGFSCDCEFLCPGDFNLDGERNVDDLLLFLSAYGQPCEDLFPGE